MSVTPSGLYTPETNIFVSKPLNIAANIGRTPPAHIRDFRAEIDAKIRVAELRHSLTGQIDQESVDEIVAMKLNLDNLYLEWCSPAGNEAVYS